MSKRADVSCNDCYFRRANLCALRTEVPCPTFRAVSKGSIAVPKQPRLLPRPVAA